ncbi:MAG: cation-translocating P-type ATPase [Candidatus Humimicrobiaceae bacterium]
MGLTRRKKTELILTIISGAFTLVAIVHDIIHVPDPFTLPLFLLAVVTGGFFIAIKGFKAIFHLSFDMNFLVTVAVIGAFAIGEHMESAIVVLLFNIANTLESFSTNRARKAIKSLMDISPDYATLLAGEDQIKTKVEKINIGQVILIKPGERIPLDGEVIEGSSYVNQSPITGESKPVKKEKGDNTYSGSINGSGSLKVRVEKIFSQSTVSKIKSLIEEAQAKKAKTQQFIEKFAQYYTPIVIGISVFIAIIPPLVLNLDWGEWIYRALTILVISCPCALVISTPITVVSGLTLGARNGVLIKGGEFLENIGSSKVFVFDKTGTLTKGEPEISRIIAYNGHSQDEVLRIAYSIEKMSEHHLAKAIIGYGKNKSIKPLKVDRFNSLSGMGIEAEIEGSKYYLGNHKLFKQKKLCGKIVDRDVKNLESRGNTVVYLGTERKTVGIIAIADRLRHSAKQTIKELKQLGIKKIAMLTGDNQSVAEDIASELEIDEFNAELLPQDKINLISRLQEKHKNVVMVGDGINDAPALSLANVGIAMGGGGSDTALESSDIALLKDDLSKIPFIYRISRKVTLLIKQNIFFAIAIKIAFLILAGLGIATLWMAVIADVGATILVVFNGLRALRLGSPKISDTPK